MSIVSVGAEFIVNQTTAGDQTGSKIKALPDGRFIVTWTDASVTGGDVSNYAVRARIFNADGTESVPEFLVNTTTDNHQNRSSVTGLADGRIMLSWTDASETGGDTSGSAIRARIFNANGTESVPEFLINTSTDNSQSESTAATLADGRIIVTWNDNSWSTGDVSGTAVRARIFNPDGSEDTPEFVVNATTTAAQESSRVVPFVDGRFLVTWTDSSAGVGDTSSLAVRARIFNANGTQSVPEFVVNTTTASLQYENSPVLLSDGRFMITWMDASQTGGDTSSGAIRARIFNADGSQSVAEFLVNTTTVNHQAENTVTALADGRIMVTWTDFSATGGDTSARAIRGRIFNGDGTEALPEFVVNTTTLNAQYTSSITTLVDGRIVVAWTDSSLTGADTSGASIRAKIFNPTVYNGDTGNDKANGGSMHDLYSGHGGNDTLSGGGGNDTLNGGDGADYLFSGAGINTLNGGAGIDILVSGGASDVMSGGMDQNYYYRMSAGSSATTGGDNSDIFIGGAFVSNDTFSGGLGDDYALGGDGDDSLNGDIGSDVLIGGNGNDILNGGDGADYLYSGAGTNSFNGGAGIDVIISEGGSDVMNGGSDQNFYYRLADGESQSFGGDGVDILVGGAVSSNDIFHGFGGNDFALGGSGNDELFGGLGDDILLGGDGNDVLDGGLGINYLYADGVGNDVIRINADLGDAQIQLVSEFASGGTEDCIELSGSTLTNFAGYQALLANVGNVVNGNLLQNIGTGAVLTLNLGATNQTSVWFLGNSAYSLTATDFQFI